MSDDRVIKVHYVPGLTQQFFETIEGVQMYGPLPPKALRAMNNWFRATFPEVWSALEFGDVVTCRAADVPSGDMPCFLLCTNVAEPGIKLSTPYWERDDFQGDIPLLFAKYPNIVRQLQAVTPWFYKKPVWKVIPEFGPFVYEVKYEGKMCGDCSEHKDDLEDFDGVESDDGEDELEDVEDQDAPRGYYAVPVSYLFEESREWKFCYGGLAILKEFCGEDLVMRMDTWVFLKDCVLSANPAAVVFAYLNQQRNPQEYSIIPDAVLTQVFAELRGAQPTESNGADDAATESGLEAVLTVSKTSWMLVHDL